MNRPVRAARRLRSATAKAPKKPRDEVILDALERLLARIPMSKLDVEPIATEAGITRARFYAYYTSKHDALAALLRRLLAIREAVAEHSGSWFAGRLPEVPPRDALRDTIERGTEGWWPPRFVLRGAFALWAAVPGGRD